MPLAITYSRCNHGIDPQLVSVETHLSNGLPAFTLVGLPETAVKESRDRVRSAIVNSHFEFPQSKITINLAPADLPKEGSRFDLAIAIGILAASGQIPSDALDRYEFIGELALSGELRKVRGLLPALIHQEKLDRRVVLPSSNRAEARLPTNAECLVASHLLEVCAHLHKRKELIEVKKSSLDQHSNSTGDIADIAGQPQAKRALEIAAAGGHNLLLSGPPGTGKTMLASRLPGILPPLNKNAAIEVAALHSLAGKSPNLETWRDRPFRSPHHTASAVALVGGGSYPKPGEISLAHHGILFLDELPEFGRKVLEVLREPLESGKISISRAAQQIEFPANFQLIAAMNPCPCGFYGDSQRSCRCSPAQIERYHAKLSGPLLDRIDMQVNVNRVPPEMLFRESPADIGNRENSASVRAKVLDAHRLQFRRAQCMNAALDANAIRNREWFGEDALEWLSHALEKLQLSARAFHRLLRVARTIADLEQVSQKSEVSPVNTHHVKEALSFRQFNAAQR